MTRPDVGTIEDSTPVMFHCCPIDSRVGRCQNHHLIHHNPHHMFACQSQCCPKIATDGRCQSHILPVYPPSPPGQPSKTGLGHRQGPNCYRGLKAPPPPLPLLHDPGISARAEGESQRSSLKREREFPGVPRPRRLPVSPQLSGTCPEAHKFLPNFFARAKPIEMEIRVRIWH